MNPFLTFTSFLAIEDIYQIPSKISDILIIFFIIFRKTLNIDILGLHLKSLTKILT